METSTILSAAAVLIALVGLIFTSRRGYPRRNAWDAWTHRHPL